MPPYFDKAIWLLGIQPIEVFTCVVKYIGTRMPIASLFVIIKKKRNALSVMNGEWLKMLKYTYIIGLYVEIWEKLHDTELILKNQVAK